MRIGRGFAEKGDLFLNAGRLNREHLGYAGTINLECEHGVTLNASKDGGLDLAQGCGTMMEDI